MIQHPFFQNNIQSGTNLLDQYEVKEAVSHGYICRTQDSDADFLLKPVAADMDSQDVQEWQQAANHISEALVHQNIAHLIACGKDAKTGVFFNVVQIAQGEKIQHWGNKKRINGILPLETVIPILRQIASALDYAGSKGLPHPALKPESIVVMPQEKVMLHDYDLLLLPSSRRQQYLASSPDLDWPVCYMPPEVCQGKPITQAANEYTLAVIAYEFLAGHVPFDNSNITILRQAILNEQPADINSLTASQNAVLFKALAKQPNNRYTSCTDFINALENAANSPTTPSPTDSIKAFFSNRLNILLFCILAVFVLFVVKISIDHVRSTHKSINAESSAQPANISSVAQPLAQVKQTELETIQKAVENQKAAEEAKRIEEAKKAEEARKAAEEAKRIEEAKKVEEARKAAEEAKRIEEAKKAEEARKAAEAAKRLKAAEEAKRIEEAKKAEEARKAAEEAKRIEEAKKAAEEAKRLKAAEEAKRIEEAKKAAEAKRAAEEAKRIEAARKAMEEVKRQQEARKAAEEAKRIEAARKAMEEAKRQEEARKAAEEAKRVEEAKKAQEKEKFHVPFYAPKYLFAKEVQRFPAMLELANIELLEKLETTINQAAAQEQWHRVKELSEKMKNYDIAKARHWQQIAETRLAPSVHITAWLDGKEVNAIILNQEKSMTPLHLTNLVPGALYTGDLLYERNGERFTGTINFKVDWKGEQEQRIMLKSTLPSLDLPLQDAPSIQLIKVEAGDFWMGEDSGSSDETRHSVKLTKDFWMGRHEISQKQWKAVMGANPSNFKSDDNPVEGITWTEAMTFCEKLNTLAAGSIPDGFKVSLPTEAQWEYAARGGKYSKHFPYSGSDKIDDVAWHSGNANVHTQPIGMKLPNELGLFDMTGNVWEWCLDTCEWENEVLTDTYRDNIVDPFSTKGALHIIRGGGWLSSPKNCRIANRLCCETNFKIYNLGLRIVLVPKK